MRYPPINIEEVGGKLIIRASNEGRAWLAEEKASTGRRYDALMELSAISESNGGFHIINNDAAGFMTSSLIWGHAHYEDDGSYTVYGKVYADPEDMFGTQEDRLFRHGRAELELLEDFGDGQTQPPIDSADYNAVQDWRWDNMLNPNPPPCPVSLQPPKRGEA